MSKLKIIHLTTSLKMGGAETILFDLLRNMDSNLYENHVIYFYEGPFVDKISQLGIKTYQIKGLFCKYDPIFFLRTFLLIKKLKPDCIHSLLWSANVVASLFSWILNIPLVCALHLATNFESKGKNSVLRQFIDNVTLKRPAKIIVVSQAMISDIQNYSWFNLNKIQVIKNSIDSNFIMQVASKTPMSKELLGINEDCFVVGSVGRFIQRKNHALLIEAFAIFSKQVSNSKLILIGYGQLKDALINQCKKLDILDKVIFIDNQAHKYYSIFDCFVLTSLNESFGLVTLEAMCFNVPCIVASDSLEHEIVQNDVNGFIVKYEAVIICEKIMEVYSRVDLRNFFVKNGIKTVDNFDVKSMVKDYCDIFKKISVK